MEDLTAITRKEKYLAKAGGQDVEVPLPPITRKEKYINGIIEEGGGGSGGKLPDRGNHTTINGIDVYVSSTQPTGTIAEGSIGFGW